MSRMLQFYLYHGIMKYEKGDPINEGYFQWTPNLSLRKYSIGVCSVLLGTALFAAGAQSASADEATAASESAGQRLQAVAIADADETPSKALNRTNNIFS